jgi:hypothetical protein
MFSTVLSRRSRNVLFTLTGVLVFKFLLQESGLLPLAGRELIAAGIPLAVAVGVLPFLAGFVTGLALGFAGAAFPLVVGLLGAEGSGLTPLSTLVLAFGFGFGGMMLSPVHLCLVVTREYFSAPFLKVYPHLVPCVFVVLTYAVLAHVVLRTLGW